MSLIIETASQEFPDGFGQSRTLEDETDVTALLGETGFFSELVRVGVSSLSNTGSEPMGYFKDDPNTPPIYMDNLTLHLDADSNCNAQILKGLRREHWARGGTVLFQPPTDSPRVGFTIVGPPSAAAAAISRVVDLNHLMDSGRFSPDAESKLRILLLLIDDWVGKAMMDHVSSASYVMGLRNAQVYFHQLQLLNQSEPGISTKLGFPPELIQELMDVMEIVLDLLYSELNREKQLFVHDWTLPENRKGCLLFIDGRFDPQKENPRLVHGRWVTADMQFGGGPVVQSGFLT